MPVDVQHRKGKQKRVDNNRITETYIVPAQKAFNVGLAFDNNHVVEGLAFSSDGSAGRLVGLQVQAALPPEGQEVCGETVALRASLRASGF